MATLSSTWQDVYADLRSYTAANPRVGIDGSSVSIPADARGEFYRLFDAVRRTFVEQNYLPLPVEAESLSKGYSSVEEELTRLLGLDGILAPAGLAAFLHDPIDGLARTLFDGLFDLLQGKTDTQTFEKLALKQLDSTCAEMCRLGYEIWVALTLVSLLDPDQASQIDLDSDERVSFSELKTIAMGHQFPHPTLRFPEFVVHSRRYGKYIAFKSELATEIPTYTTASRPERKLAMQNAGDTSTALGHRVLLMSVVERPEDVAMIADLEERQVFPPDVAVECQEDESAVVEAAGSFHDILQPRGGTYVVFRETGQRGRLQALPENIYRLAVGFDPFGLKPIVESLVSRKPLAGSMGIPSWSAPAFGRTLPATRRARF
jgi:hypothetical protein